MEGRRDEQHLHAPQRTGGIRWSRRRLTRGADRKIGAPRGERVPRAAEHLVRKAQACSRALFVELARHSVQAIEAYDGVDGDAQLRLPALRDLLDATFEVGCRPQQSPSFGEQLAAGRGEHCPVSAAVEELDAQSFFELAYGVSDR